MFASGMCCLFCSIQHCLKDDKEKQSGRMEGQPIFSLEYLAKISVLFFHQYCLDAFFQAQKGSILYCLAKVLSLFEVSSVPDVFVDFDNDFFANVVYLDFKIIIMIIQMFFLFLKWPKGFLLSCI